MALPSSKRRLQQLANQKVARRVGPASSLTSATQKPRGTTPFALSLLGGRLVGPGSGFGSRGFAEEVSESCARARGGESWRRRKEHSRKRKMMHKGIKTESSMVSLKISKITVVGVPRIRARLECRWEL